MKKLIVLVYSLSLLGLCWYGLSNHTYYLQLLTDLSSPFMIVRISLATVLIAYAFVPQMRSYFAKTLMGIGGVALLLIGLVSTFSPTMIGYFNGYILIGDSLTLLEGGILAIVLCAELPAQRTRYTARSIAYIASLRASKHIKLTYPVIRPVVFNSTKLQPLVK